MRRLFSVFLLLVFTASCGGVSIPEDYVSFVSSDGHLSIYHPSDWFYGQDETDLEALFLASANPVFIFPHPREADLILVDTLSGSALSEERILSFMETFKASTEDYSYGELSTSKTMYGYTIYFTEGKSVDGNATFLAYVSSDLGSLQIMYAGLYETLELSRDEIELAFKSIQFL